MTREGTGASSATAAVTRLLEEVGGEKSDLAVDSPLDCRVESFQLAAGGGEDLDRKRQSRPNSFRTLSYGMGTSLGSASLLRAISTSN